MFSLRGCLQKSGQKSQRGPSLQCCCATMETNGDFCDTLLMVTVVWWGRGLVTFSFRIQLFHPCWRHTRCRHDYWPIMWNREDLLSGTKPRKNLSRILGRWMIRREDIERNEKWKVGWKNNQLLIGIFCWRRANNGVKSFCCGIGKEQSVVKANVDN